MLAKSRFIAGIICFIIAVLIFIFGKGRIPTTSGVAFTILGVIMVAISKKK